MKIVSNMQRLATKWHAGQFRKDGVTPYIKHPEDVVKQLEDWGYSEETSPVVLAIAWGHDLIEDTAVPTSEILDACEQHGLDVISGLAWLTFREANWPDAKNKKQAKELYIANIAKSAPPDILAIKLADRFCNLRDFVKLCGERTEKPRSYWFDAEKLFENIRRLPENLRNAVWRTKNDEIHDLIFPDPYELRDAWVSDYYIVENPPIAYGYVFEGCLAFDGDDFCMGFSREEDEARRRVKSKKVPRYVAEAYGRGDICPEEIDWGSKAVEWPRKERTCTSAMPCFGSIHCRASAKGIRTEEEIVRLVHDLPSVESEISDQGCASDSHTIANV